MKLKKGNVENLQKFVGTSRTISLVKTDYSEQIIKHIIINDGRIYSCNFIETGFYGNEFSNCDFISCNFSKADFINISFINCVFHECKFDDAALKEVNFENCQINSCSWKRVEFDETVTGLSEDDINVIHEANENLIDLNVLIDKYGFEKPEDDCYSLNSSNNFAKIVICKDDEAGDDVYRLMLEINVNDSYDSVLSNTIDLNEETTFDEILIDIKYLLNNGKYIKIDEFVDDDSVKEDIKNNFITGVKELKLKF